MLHGGLVGPLLARRSQDRREAAARPRAPQLLMLARLCPSDHEDGEATDEPDMDVLKQLGTNSGVVLSHNECVAVNGFVVGLSQSRFRGTLVL